MRYAEVAENVQRLIAEPPDPKSFVYDFLQAYGTPKATISRLKLGSRNLSKEPGECLLKKKLFFKALEGDPTPSESPKEEPSGDRLFGALDALKTNKLTRSHDPRFLFVTDFRRIVAVDRKTVDTLDCKLRALDRHLDFFLPLAGMEKTRISNENPADIRAAERMARLFDAIRQRNPEFLTEKPHAMNVFLARLLFCLFAEDTGIFPENAMSNAIASRTSPDASDLHDFFVLFFDILDRKSRDGLPEHLKDFPYVNGGLFREHFPIPEFSMKARRMILEAGELTWAEINPDIFGSMFQAVIDPEERHNLGQHYTSVTNIMKVIEPLFLNDFRAELDKARKLTRGKTRALHRLLDRIAAVRIFDPACGSGNFLIIAYKELRRLEMDIFKELQSEGEALPLSRISVDQFFGIEISDFAAETAILALWLTEHQMNLESHRVCGQAPDNLPLREGARVVCGNACRVDWETVCPKPTEGEVYILGNPPYLGARVQSKSNKADMAAVFGTLNGVNNLDYITCWFAKASQYIRGTRARYAFVSTNSICQGEQVAMIWPHLLGEDLEIGFAHRSFKWTNNAKGNAGVTCVVVGVRGKTDAPKALYANGIRDEVANINAYLSNAPDVFIFGRRQPLAFTEKVAFGSMPNDGGGLILNRAEKDRIIRENPEHEKYLRSFLGSSEFIRGLDRWCLWLVNANLSDFSPDTEIGRRIEKVRQHRSVSRRDSTKELARCPHLFGEIRHTDSPSIIIPASSSERRQYIPIGFLDKNTVISNAAFGVFKADPSLFALLTSRMHMTWIRAVGGRLKTDYRYSARLCYNTFPVPDLSEAQKASLKDHTMEVIRGREYHSEKTLAQLYDPDKMPEMLRTAHQNLDQAVDQLYRKTPFTSDEERLEHLFKLYEAMIAKERKGGNG